MQIIHPLEPIWHDNLSQVPTQLRATGSMTHYMQQRSERCFQVKLLAQTWQNPRSSEALALSISKYSSVLLREVYLLCDDVVCMFARCLFPTDALFGKSWQLQYLGEKPLGELLFNDPKLRRSPFEFALLRAGDEDYAKATAHLSVKPDLVWARRSIFCWQQKELMVEEVFLPGLIFDSIEKEDIRK
jgi:chorismate--pyruvate lyase